MNSDNRWHFTIYYATLFFLINSTAGFAQSEGDPLSNVNKDSLLIADMNVQMDANEAINLMYNFKFIEARKQFNWFKQYYPEHPLPYFLMGLNEWWQIMPNLDVESHDEHFYAYMDTSIMKAKELISQDFFKQFRPKTYSKRSICISTCSELRKQFISSYRAFCEACKRAYECWKLGDFSVEFPPGAFRPRIAPTASPVFV